VSLEPLHARAVAVLLAEVVSQVSEWRQGHILLTLAPHGPGEHLYSHYAFEKVGAHGQPIGNGARVIFCPERRRNWLRVKEIEIHKIGMPGSSMNSSSQGLLGRHYVVKLGKRIDPFLLGFIVRKRKSFDRGLFDLVLKPFGKVEPARYQGAIEDDSWRRISNASQVTAKDPKIGKGIVQLIIPFVATAPSLD